jgi:hemerythrin
MGVAYFEWKEEYSGGIGPIDDQHRTIIAIMNELFDALRYGKEDAVIRGVFVQLLKYANYHFSLEAELFEKYRYDDRAAHAHQHEHFIQKVKDLAISDYLTDRNVPLETLHYLRSWFQDHMLKIDMEYCRQFSFLELMGEIDDFLRSFAAEPTPRA